MIYKSECCNDYVFPSHEGEDICNSCNRQCEVNATNPCRGNGCEEQYSMDRFDAHGIPTGSYCDECYETNYPYRKDRYPTIETHGYGERLDDDY